MNNTINHRQFRLAIIIVGFSSMMSQIILLRELIIIFQGNELTLGIIFSIWLAGTAIGSGVIGKLVKYLTKPLRWFLILQTLFVILLPAVLVFIRLSPGLFQIARGDLMPLPMLFIIPIISLFPMCLIIGFSYTLCCSIYHTLSKETTGAIIQTYLLEALGAGFASFIVSIVLLKYLAAYQFITIIFLLNIFMVAWLNYLDRRKTLLISILLVIIAVGTSTFFLPRVDRFSLTYLWKGFELITLKNTVYGNIEVTKYDSSISFYENGTVLFTSPDPLSSEEAVHFALLEHPQPQSVLLIGGGIGGALEQVLFHPSVERVDYVELDPEIIKLGRKYLPLSNTKVLQDKRVHVWIRDGRLFLKQTNNRYDVVIVNLPEPKTILLNRFYSYEFYKELLPRMSSNGIVSFGITSSENVIGADLANFLGCLYATMNKVFAEVVLIPGDTNHFIACVNKNILTSDVKTLVDRLQQRQLPTIYFREYYLPYRLSPDRIEYLYTRIAEQKSPRINYDLKPVGNFYNLVVWTTYFNQRIKNIFLFFDKIGWQGIYSILFIILITFLIIQWRQPDQSKKFRLSLVSSVMMIGFTNISLEVIIILGFQAIYGYAYFQVALIFSCMMMGLALGSYLSSHEFRKSPDPLVKYRVIQSVVVVFPLILIFILINANHYAQHPWLTQIIFLSITVIAGLIAGVQFSLANRLYWKIKPLIEQTAGSVYAFDLAGACLGSLLTSLLFIPILGVIQSCVVIALFNLFVLLSILMINGGAKRGTQT
jgi:spermidine synthase